MTRASISSAWLRTAGLAIFASGAACSLLLSPSDLDAQYGRDGGGGTSTGHGGHAGAAGTAGASEDGGDGGCPCKYGCDEGRCVAGTVDSARPNGIACGPDWVYVVGPSPLGLVQYAKSGGRCSCIAENDPAALATGYEVAVGGGQVVWRTVDSNSVYRFWALPDVDCCSSTRAANLVVSQTTPTNNSIDFGNGLATDGVSVFWLDDASVKRAPLNVADAGPGTAIVEADGGLDGLAITSSAAFYNEYNITLIQATNLYDGGGARSWPEGPRCRGVQTNGHYAAWAAVHTGPDGGEIHGMSIDDPSASPAPLSMAFGQPSGLAIDDSYVYVADSLLGTVSRVAIAAPNAVDTLWSLSGTSPANACTDGTFVYWLTSTNGKGLLRIEKAPP